MFSGLKLKMDKPNEYWSRRFVESLKTLPGSNAAVASGIGYGIGRIFNDQKACG